MSSPDRLGYLAYVRGMQAAFNENPHVKIALRLDPRLIASLGGAAAGGIAGGAMDEQNRLRGALAGAGVGGALGYGGGALYRSMGRTGGQAAKTVARGEQAVAHAAPAAAPGAARQAPQTPHIVSAEVPRNAPAAAPSTPRIDPSKAQPNAVQGHAINADDPIHGQQVQRSMVTPGAKVQIPDAANAAGAPVTTKNYPRQGASPAATPEAAASQRYGTPPDPRPAPMTDASGRIIPGVPAMPPGQAPTQQFAGFPAPSAVRTGPMPAVSGTAQTVEQPVQRMSTMPGNNPAPRPQQPRATPSGKTEMPAVQNPNVVNPRQPVLRPQRANPYDLYKVPEQAGPPQFQGLQYQERDPGRVYRDPRLLQAAALPQPAPLVSMSSAPAGATQLQPLHPQAPTLLPAETQRDFRVPTPSQMGFTPPSNPSYNPAQMVNFGYDVQPGVMMASN
jgi:hypothetical protein